MTLQKTKLIMFDYDGVLIDSTHLPKQFYDKLSVLLGTRKFKSKEELREFLEADVLLSLARLGVNTEEQHAIAMNLFKKQDKNWKNLSLFPHVKGMLKTLKMKGYILAIVSNNNKETIEYDLKRNKVFDYFDHIIDHTHGRKPAPDQIIHCLKITQTYPEHAVMIDDMDGGIIAAKKAKLKKAIGVSYGYQLPYRLKMADIIVDHPKAIVNAVE